jgi:hypothetical protein
MLLLLLVVPIALMAGQPVELARLVTGGRGLRKRFIRPALGRILMSPVAGPALIPFLGAVLFFGPLPGWAISQDVVAAMLPIRLVLIGCFVALPLVSVGDRRGSLAVGLALAVGMLELLLDAVPGIVLRLQTSLSSSYFEHRQIHAWSPRPLRDQQIGGAILWSVAELLDLPFLVLIFMRWTRADAEEAAQIDTVLDAERFARAALVSPAAPGENGPASSGQTDGPDDDSLPGEPWWLTDPTPAGPIPTPLGKPEPVSTSNVSRCRSNFGDTRAIREGQLFISRRSTSLRRRVGVVTGL